MDESNLMTMERRRSVAVADAPSGGVRTVTHAVLREPPRSMGWGLTTQTLGAPDVDLALEQFQSYVDALRRLKVTVTVLDADDENPDSHFVEDVAVIHKGVAVMTNPGAEARRREVPAMREALAALMPVVDVGGGTAHVEGGDVLFVDDNVFIGLSRRTNVAGATRLRHRLLEIDPGLSVRYVPISGVLHLKTGLTAANRHTLLRDPACRFTGTLPFARTVTLPAEEGHAANVMPVNDGMIITSGSDTLDTVAHACAREVVGLDMSEFRKMDGSLTCLSLLWNSEAA